MLWAADERPAPLGHVASAGTPLFLELIVNEVSSGEVVPVLARDGNYYITAGVLRSLHVKTQAAPDALVAVNLIDGVAVQYDSIGQRLKLMLPVDWLPAQELGSGRRNGLGLALGSQGFLLNYDFYASRLGRDGGYASLWTEQRFFGDWGVLSNTGVYRRSFDDGRGEYIRYDTRWSYSDTERVMTYAVGDLITGALPWGTAVRLGGIQISRNFAVRPDLIPYPVPLFSGQAAVPSAVELFVNGHKASSETVQPGPFTLNTMPFINGAGEASVVTTDALGRQVVTTVPFYIASTLLKTGTNDYALAFGALRKDYGVNSFSYGQTVAAGLYRLGVTDHFTVEGRAELAREFRLLGVGVDAALGHYGVGNASLAQSHRAGHSGRQVSIGYQYNAQRFGLGVQHTRRDATYTDLAGIDAPTAVMSQRTTQLTASGSLGAQGSVSAGYFDVLAADGQSNRLATLAYSRPLGARNFLQLNLNKVIGQPNFNVQLQWTLLLDSAGSISTSATRDKNGQGQQVQYSRSPPPSGGLGWNLGYADAGGNDFRQASATWRGSQAQLQAGVFSQGNQSSTWVGATGSVVAMDGGVFAANRINDAFVLVSTDGVPDVPLYFENQLIGQTNKNGHLLVPGITAHYPARFEIDALNLPDYMQITQAEQRVVLRSGSGMLLRFEIQMVRAASVTLVDEQGRPLPVGLLVQHVQSGRSAVVGWEGLVYLEDLKNNNDLLVSGGSFPACRAQFALDTVVPGISRIGPLSCRTLPSAASAPF